MLSVSSLKENFDPELLQAKWVLGGIEPEEFVGIAISALQQGFDGTALQQLAGLSRPTLGDLGHLPERVFAGLGLKPIDKDEAISVLLRRGQPATAAVVSALLKSFPGFASRWKEHVALWGGNPAGSYNDMGEFVHFVVEDLYGKGNLADTDRAFRLLEEHLMGADAETRNLIGLGFLETLQSFASWGPGGNKVYEQFLGPISKQIWAELQEMWRGKSSLMDVIRAERRASAPDKS